MLSTSSCWKNQLPLSACLVLLITCSCVGAAPDSSCCQCTKNCNQCTPCLDEAYTYFLFVLQWPPTFCRKPDSCCDERIGRSNFTIHGLWPEKSKNCYPYCCGPEPFRPSEVSDFLAELKTYWPSLSCHGTDDSFHEHEWVKHGTCSLESLPDPKTSTPVRAYFQRTLELREGLPLLDILSKAGIHPSNEKTYPIEEIRSAIKSAVGTLPDLECHGDYLDEVHFCMKKDLKTFIDCPTKMELPNQPQTEDKALTRKHHHRRHRHPHGYCPDQVKLPVFHPSIPRPVS